MEHLEKAAPRPLSPRYLEVSEIEVTLAQDVYGGHGPEGRCRQGMQGDRRAAVRHGRPWARADTPPAADGNRRSTRPPS